MSKYCTLSLCHQWSGPIVEKDYELGGPVSSQIAGVISLLIALAAVYVAAWQVRTSARLTVNSNSLPAITRVFEEWRSEIFRGHVNNLKDHSSDAPAAGGFDALPDEWRDSAYTVCYFFDYIGTLMLFGLIDDDIIIGTLASQAVVIWRMLETHIFSEREHREATYPPGASPGFLKFYEHMIAKIMNMGGENAAANVQQAKGMLSLQKRLNPPTAPPELETSE
jgi:hypothetical protein